MFHGSFPQQYWFLLDERALRMAKKWEGGVDAAKKALAATVLRYIRWLPLSPESNSVASLYLNQVGSQVSPGMAHSVGVR